MFQLSNPKNPMVIFLVNKNITTLIENPRKELHFFKIHSKGSVINIHEPNNVMTPNKTLLCGITIFVTTEIRSPTKDICKPRFNVSLPKDWQKPDRNMNVQQIACRQM